ncbi:MAG: hypothetical protein KDK25_01615 [Leptospiraceae bacterium]|nr:hypothetical protein [Leptospiraceae bacterium]
MSDGDMQKILREIQEKHISFELERIRSKSWKESMFADYEGLLSSGAQLKLGDLFSLEEFQTANWMFVRLGLETGAGDIIKKRTFVEILETRPGVFQFSLDRLISGERAREMIQASLKLEKLRKELIRTAVYNPFFAQFLSDVLYNGIKGFLADGGLGKDIPVAGNIMRAGQALLGKAMEGFQGNLEKPIKEFIRKNIDSTMHHTEKMLYSAFEGEEFAETAYEIYQDWASRELGAMLELVSPEEYEAAATLLVDWPQFLAESKEMEGLVRGASGAFFEARQDSDLSSILKEHAVESGSAARALAEFHFRLLRWEDKSGLLEKRIRQRMEDFYGQKNLLD